MDAGRIMNDLWNADPTLVKTFLRVHAVIFLKDNNCVIVDTMFDKDVHKGSNGIIEPNRTKIVGIHIGSFDDGLSVCFTSFILRHAFDPWIDIVGPIVIRIADVSATEIINSILDTVG